MQHSKKIIFLFITSLFLTSVVGFSSSKAPEVVICGGGPVGLWTSIQTKVRTPQARVVIYEKRPSFTRNQNVKITTQVFSELSRMVQRKDVKRELQSLQRDVTHHAIKIRHLEERLSALARALGVEITQREIGSVADLMALHGQPAVIIGADGSKSVIRRDVTMCQEASVIKAGTSSAGERTTLQHTVYANITIPMDAKVESFMKSHSMVQMAAATLAGNFMSMKNYTVHCNVSKPDADGNVSLTAIFSVPMDATHKELASCVKTNPGRIGGTDRRVPQALCQDVSGFFRDNFTAVDLSQVALVSVPVERYRSARAARLISSVPVLLVGDACFGIPYFASLKEGLSLSCQASELMTEHMKGRITGDALVVAYSQRVDREWERAALETDGKAKVAKMVTDGVQRLRQSRPVLASFLGHAADFTRDRLAARSQTATATASGNGSTKKSFFSRFASFAGDALEAATKSADQLAQQRRAHAAQREARIERERRAQLEAARLEQERLAREEAARQEAARQEAARQEAARQEAARQACKRKAYCAASATAVALGSLALSSLLGLI